LISDSSNYTYETLTKSSVIKTVEMTVGDPTIKFLWGLSAYDGKDYGCPIGIYLSNSKFVYNKVELSYTFSKAFPSANYKITVNTDGVDSLSEASIYTDFSEFSGKTKTCSYDPTANQITCINIAAPSA